jgi:hypothetical protein
MRAPLDGEARLYMADAVDRGILSTGGHMKRTLALSGVLLGALSTWGVGAQRSSSPEMLTLSVGGGAVAIGDLNADENADIVTVGSDAVAVFLGDGRGRFEQGPGSPFAAGSKPNDVALADFNGDGRLDVAVANHETSYLSVLLGSGARLSPPFQIVVPSRPHPHGVAASDFNRDGRVDLAVESWAENALLVAHGSGDGRFASETLRVPAGRMPYQKLRAADLDNDGVGDLVATNTDGSSVSVACSQRGSALGPTKEIAIAPFPFAVAAGDVNGDRIPDLAVAHRWGAVDPNRDHVSVLIGSGDCSFVVSAGSPMKAGASPTDIAIGDVDGDGIGDVAVANMGSDNVSLFYGGRSGVRPDGRGPLPTGKAPTAIALGDLNGDGKADIVTGNIGRRDLSVRLSP